jgi:hypothetical protein
MSHFDYPLHVRFKLIALAPRIIVTEPNGNEVLYIHQKTFALKEDVRIYSDQSKSEEIYRINAQSIIDFSARYNITESRTEKQIGHIQSKGFRSIWITTYELYDAAEVQTHLIEEDNPLVKVADYFFSQIDYIGALSGYFLHPSYTVKSTVDGQEVMRIIKQPAFWEGVYRVDLLDANASYEEEIRSLLALMLLIQFMRGRG